VSEAATPRDLLIRYLRQRAELGEREIILERQRASQLLERLYGAGAAGPAGDGRSGERVRGVAGGGARL
jgi:hypothetical protein